MPDKQFEVGVVHLTTDAMIALIDSNVSALTLLERHQNGDWAEVDAEDKNTNNQAVKDGTRLLSSYAMCDGCRNTRIWLITEADHSKTTFLLPSEY